jgi:hypothetical protein
MYIKEAHRDALRSLRSPEALSRIRPCLVRFGLVVHVFSTYFNCIGGGLSA